MKTRNLKLSRVSDRRTRDSRHALPKKYTVSESK